MQSNGLILASSIIALALCALPYGCSGKYVDDRRPAGTAGKAGADGRSTDGAQYIADGAYSPPRDGHGAVDGAYSGGDGFYNSGDGGYIPSDGARYVEGVSFIDGTFFGGDGIAADGSSALDGSDGWDDPQPDGLDGSQPDGWADGDPIP
jgi:hypothetical protein